MNGPAGTIEDAAARAEAASTLPARRRNRLAARYEATVRPGLFLFGIVFGLYGSSLLRGFVIDDYRCLRHLREYHEGHRDRPDLYRFLPGGEVNASMRAEGWFPWWLGDDVRYLHLRPASEVLIYGEFLLFGGAAWGYHAVSVALYLLGVRLALALFRVLAGDELTARWAAFFYAVAAGHAICVVFAAAQCDLLAMVGGIGAVLCAARFVLGGGPAWLAASAALYLAGIGGKEACLPVCVLPMCVWLARREAADLRRAVGATALLSVFGLAWLGLYAAGGYGADTMLMLDPLRATGGYLWALPGRALLLLASGVIPFNPFVFYFEPRAAFGVFIYGALGAAALYWFGRMLWRRHRADRRVRAMALWIAPFIPLLVCTIPDDRVMMLPGVGFAMLAGVWMARVVRDDAVRWRRLPGVLFGVVPIIMSFAVAGSMQTIEKATSQTARAAVAGFERPAEPGDCVFILNTEHVFQVLFFQDCLREATGERGVRAAFLSDVPDPRVEVMDERTLRITADGDGLLAGFLGKMGAARGRPKREGDILIAGEFTARIARVEDGVVRAVDLEFRRRLDSDHYRFYTIDAAGGLQRCEFPAGTIGASVGGQGGWLASAAGSGLDEQKPNR